eukprot:GHUV01014790.1.p1 GENE.GHUV01014790.1~~GHUV01014790.1.p1  ORF type:complete len:436 (+),score=163.77 GHUV01014790.1:629-1936(+)
MLKVLSLVLCRILHLVKSEGTIPIHYQAHKYNIPIVVWLPERYPTQAPIVYVSPTPNMIIKTGHSFVDASGLVHSPCINHWLYPTSDLSSTCQEMAMLFGAEPPLYSKPPGYEPPLTTAAQGPSSNPYAGYPQQQPQHAQLQPGVQQQQLGGYPGAVAQQQQQPNAGLASHSIWGAAYAAAAGSVARPPGPPAAGPATAAAGPSSSSSLGYGVQQTPPPPPVADPKQRQKEELIANFQGLASRALAGRLQAGLEAYNRHAAEEMDQLLEVQHKLIAREQQLQSIVSSTQQERMGTEGLVAQLGKQSAALEAWLSSHEWKADAVNAAVQSGSNSGGMDVNKVIVPADDLSRQALAAQAEDLAVEDCLLVLEKGMLQGKIEPDVYLKQVRLLCRKQFLARALGLKVAQAQRQQPQQRVSGQQGPAFTLTHGDTWSHR